MAVLSCPHRNSDSNNFNNFSYHRSEECPHHFSWHSDQICRRSSSKCGACPILVISCHQEGALWVWLNLSIWMASGRDSYHTHKVSCRLDNVEWSYKHLIFLATHSKWRLRHAHTVRPIRTILISFHVTGLKSIHTVFHFISIKFVGGVC